MILLSLLWKLESYWLSPLLFVMAMEVISLLTFITLLPYRPTRSLCSLNQQLLQIQFTNTEFGPWYFIYCSPKIWNKIPAIIEASATGATIKLRLKSRFLCQSLKQSISVRLATACTSSLMFPQHCACYKLDYYYYCYVIIIITKELQKGICCMWMTWYWWLRVYARGLWSRKFVWKIKMLKVMWTVLDKIDEK